MPLSSLKVLSTALESQIFAAGFCFLLLSSMSKWLESRKDQLLLLLLSQASRKHQPKNVLASSILVFLASIFPGRKYMFQVETRTTM